MRWPGRPAPDRSSVLRAGRRAAGCAPAETAPPSPSDRAAPWRGRSGRRRRLRRVRTRSPPGPPRSSDRRRASTRRARPPRRRRRCSARAPARLPPVHTREPAWSARAGTLPAHLPWVACGRERAKPANKSFGSACAHWCATTSAASNPSQGHGAPMSERVFERANQNHGAYSSVVHRPSPQAIVRVAMVHQ